jgi:hypothetical protein
MTSEPTRRRAHSPVSRSAHVISPAAALAAGAAHGRTGVVGNSAKFYFHFDTDSMRLSGTSHISATAK